MEERGQTALPPGETRTVSVRDNRAPVGDCHSWLLRSHIWGLDWCRHMVCDGPLQTLVRTMSEGGFAPFESETILGGVVIKYDIKQVY